MAQLAISEVTTFRWSFEEDVERHRAAGIPAIGVWRQKLADIGDEKGAMLVKRAGLRVSSLQWAGGFTGSDGRTHAESLDDARHAIRTADVLRAGCLIIHSGARGVHTYKHARRIFRQALEMLVPLAEERGIVLAVEPMHSDCGEFTFLHCLDETLDLVATVDSPALGIALDTGHWGHHPQLPQRLPQLAPRLALVQLADSRRPPRGEPNRCQLGDGTVPLCEIVQCLTASGYDGDYEVELMGEEIEAANYHDILSRSLGIFQRWTNLAAS